LEEVSALANDIQSHWASIYPLLSIRNEQEYDLAIERLDSLLDEIGTNEQHPLYGLLDTLGTLIYVYEEYHPMPETSGIDTLQYFMEEHHLSPSDLPEIGPQDVVSKVLDGKLDLNVRQICALAKRFGVSPTVFF
jgi:HTH-type transcriptional regulator/antitoxin HigA